MRLLNESLAAYIVHTYMVVAYPRQCPLFSSMMPINVVQTEPVLYLHTFIPAVWISLALVNTEQPNSLVFLHCLIIPEYKSDISYVLLAILVKLTIKLFTDRFEAQRLPVLQKYRYNCKHTGMVVVVSSYSGSLFCASGRLSVAVLRVVCS